MNARLLAVLAGPMQCAPTLPDHLLARARKGTQETELPALVGVYQIDIFWQ